MQHRLTMFRMGTISMVFFDALSFISEYKRIYGPLELDNGPRVKRALTMFKDQGIMTYNLSGNPPYYPRPMKIKEFTSYPPLLDPSRPGGTLLLSFEFVASLIQQGSPVLGSFPIRTDEDSEGFTDFDKLGDKIYDYWPTDPREKPGCHLVTFVDYGQFEGRPFLKFINTYGRWWGEDGLGKVFFDCIYQRNDNYCFHTFSFGDPVPSSSSPTAAAIIDYPFTLPPPPTAQPPSRHWHAVQFSADAICEAGPGAKIVDLSVIIQPALEYQPPPTDSAPLMSGTWLPVCGDNVVHKAEDVVNTMLAKGFTVGEDVVGKAKAFDEKHGFTSIASAKVSAIDKKIGLSEKITMGNSVVNEKVREMDQKFHVSDKTKSALAAAKQTSATVVDLSVIIQPAAAHLPPPTVSDTLVRTVKVTNVPLSATVQDIEEFFSFSGDIEHVDLQSGGEWSQVAYVTFKDAQGAETTLLLSGATIVDLSVIIQPAPEYQPPSTASAPPMSGTRVPVGGDNVVHKAEDVVNTMLAKGFTLGKDAVGKTKSFDEKHGFTSIAGAKVSATDKKIGHSEKITMGISVVNEKVREMDQKLPRPPVMLGQ